MLQDDNETHDLASLADAYAKAERGLPDLLLLDCRSSRPAVLNCCSRSRPLARPHAS